jgi:OmpR family response regulator RpaB
MGKILVVVNEPKMRQILAVRLRVLGYNVTLADNFKQALQNFNKESPNLVVLDLLINESDGFKLCRKIRSTSNIPLITFSSATNGMNSVTATQIISHVYSVKFLFPKELEEKINSVFNQFYRENKQFFFQVEDLTIDRVKKQVLKKNTKLKLTNIEFILLENLIQNAGKELSRIAILTNVWGYAPERDADARVIDVTISRLRSKIEKDPTNPELILTVRGTGYMFRT